MKIKASEIEYRRKPEDNKYLTVSWSGKNYVNIVSEGACTTVFMEDLEWLRTVLFNIEYEFRKEKE